jgi:hypothetical protein
MFHMMNEARIGIGMAATMLGLAGYYASLDYAKNRPQGRPVGPAGKDAAQPQVRIIEHADVKRMLLAQKAYGEGALALMLYCARLVDEQHTGTPEAADEARLLLEVLTPIAKSWPSEFCLEANSLAIQVHGGYGYTRDFPGRAVLARQPPEHDPRGHARHPGGRPAGPQGADGRGQGPATAGRAHQRHHRSSHAAPRLAEHANALGRRCSTSARHQGGLGHRRPGEALANAVPYMQAFGHTVLAWIWLDVAACALPRCAAASGPDRAPARRQLFLSLRTAEDRRLAEVVETRDPTCADMPEEAF